MSDLVNALSEAASGSSSLPKPVVVNPLAATAGAAETASRVFGVREKQAQQALGQLYQQAIDPQTGRFDPLKLNQLISGAPLAALAAKSGVEGSQTLQGSQLEQNIKTQGMVNGAVTAALASDDANLKQAVLEQAARLRAAGIPADRIDGALLHLSSDPAQLRQQLETMRVQSLPPEQQQQVIYGSPFRQTGPGGATIGGTQNPRTGAVSGPASQSGLPQGLAPEGVQDFLKWGNEQSTWADPKNPAGQKQGTNFQRLQDQGIDPFQFLQSGGWRPGGAPAAASQSPNRPAVPPSPNRPASAPNTGTPTTLLTPAAVAANTASTDQFNAANTEASTYSQRVFPLIQAAKILDSGKVVTGEHMDAVNRVVSFLQAAGTRISGEDLQSEGQAKFDKLGKYQQDYINRQPFAARSEGALASAISGNPGTHISTLANQDVTKAMIALEMMKLAAVTDFKAQAKDPSQWTNFMRDWQTAHDPRAFLVATNMIQRDKANKMIDGMKTPAERRAFAATLDLIDKHPEILNAPAMP